MEPAPEALKKLNVFAKNASRTGWFHEQMWLPAVSNQTWSERHQSFAFRLHQARGWLRSVRRLKA
jgi:hypothetical protein